MRRFVLLFALTLLVPWRGFAQAPAAETAPAEAPWKPFQEFGAVLGSWSGTADSAGRIGGTVGRWTQEMGGNFLVHHVNTIFPAQSGKPEEVIELVGYYAYDREKRKYVASYFFSTGILGIFDVEFSAAGAIRLVSRELLNYESGARSRLVMSRKSETEQTLDLELALPGKDFVPYFTSKLTRK
ncbi:MAG: hypothetical protein ABIT01_06665 [Thermoanaerobaculia bacterium]